ncbi:hypothetical protein Lalb_Chr01g0015221 [Lupinus albus]|uniref:Uncharacterized protein n=1 Tax=Lupinus albus TaxID=3870 RepID=A0A6A4R5Z8_LUPAL|nr:hypothetical protein Lalb_Chr01g0015221 [Lupinus albus]
MVDSSNSNRDFAISNVGKGSCCWMYVTNPAYESVSPEIIFNTRRVLLTGESTLAS